MGADKASVEFLYDIAVSKLTKILHFYLNSNIATIFFFFVGQFVEVEPSVPPTNILMWNWHYCVHAQKDSTNLSSGVEVYISPVISCSFLCLQSRCIWTSMWLCTRRLGGNLSSALHLVGNCAKSILQDME